MKSEAEIRFHLAALIASGNVPCDCGGTDHESRCREGGLMMQSAAATLEWVLGENPALGAIVDSMARELSRHQEN